MHSPVVSNSVTMLKQAVPAKDLRFAVSRFAEQRTSSFAVQKEDLLNSLMDPKNSLDDKINLVKAALGKYGPLNVATLAEAGFERGSIQPIYAISMAINGDQTLADETYSSFKNALAKIVTGAGEITTATRAEKIVNLAFVAASHASVPKPTPSPGSPLETLDNGIQQAFLDKVKSLFENENIFHKPSFFLTKRQENLKMAQFSFAYAIAKIDPDYLIKLIERDYKSPSLTPEHELSVNYAIAALSLPTDSKKITELMKEVVLNPDTNPHVAQNAIKYLSSPGGPLTKDPMELGRLRHAYGRLQLNPFDKEAREEARKALEKLSK